MKKVMVPVDFSGESLNAAKYASDFAHGIEADVVLIHFLPLPVAISDAPVSLENIELASLEAQDALMRIKEQLSARWNDKICVSCEVATESFLEYIQMLNSKNSISVTIAMVMGARGKGSTEALLLGSFSLTAARHLRHPLLIIPKKCSYKKIEKIGLACDMKNVTTSLPIKTVSSIVQYFNAKLEILYIADPNEKMYYPKELIEESNSAKLSLAILQPEIKISANEDVDKGLFDFSEKSHIDLLLVIPKERSFIQKLLHKSISEKMLLHPTTPIMLLHEQQNFCLL